MLNELTEAQNFEYDLAENLITQGVPASNTEGLDTLVPKVLEIDSVVAKSPYDEWQEGFGANWDSVVANAPMTNTQRILHVYTKVEILKMASNFPTGAEIYTYNGSVYRQITMDANKRLAFVEADYITNTFDNLQYVCVVYGNSIWWRNTFETWLPVVYGNSKAATEAGSVNLLGVNRDYNYYPILRGVDVNILSQSTIFGGLEHLTYQITAQTLYFLYEGLRNCEMRLLKDVCDTLPGGLTHNLISNFFEINVRITDEALADWFYNTWLYTIYATGTRFRYPAGNYVRKFKVNSAMQLKSISAATANVYISGIPNCDYLEGTFTENQTSNAFDGLHGFNSNNMRNLKNFPLWTVLGGAMTGCLLPATSASALANFRFWSMQLERSNFALFNAGVIDTDPTKSFVANLPTVLAGSAQTILFDDTTFKNQFTEGEQAQIVSTITGKNWGLTW